VTPKDLTHIWDTDETEVLLNPRMPGEARTRLLAAQASLPPLTAHIWITTSGSSGLKWVALSKAALLASAAAVNTHLEATRADSWAQPLPLFHVGGLGILARAHLSGATVHQWGGGGEAKWEAGAFHKFLADTSAVLTSLVPTQLHDLVQTGLPCPPTLRGAVIGGGALSTDLARAARVLGWPALPSYGLSECCSQVATARPGPPALIEDDPPLILLPHITARADADGRLEIKSPALLTGYGLIGDDGTARFVDPKEDGWFLTEDRGGVTGDVLTIAGRIGDFVKIGGESVDVARLSRLWERQNVPNTVLVAAPDTRLGAAIHLAAASGIDESVLTEAVRAYNAEVLPFERVQRLHWLAAIPRSPLGKVLRTALLTLLGYPPA